MLLNLAEDLKQYARLSVAPGRDTKVEKASTGPKKKELDLTQIKTMAENAAFVRMDKQGDALDEDIYDERITDDFAEGKAASYLYMELRSTATFRDIDIDRMLEHTTLDDFMKGLYINQDGQAVSKKKKGEEQEDDM